MKDKLLDKYEELRREMISIGVKYGLNHPCVIELSQKLDRLHNEINKRRYN